MHWQYSNGWLFKPAIAFWWRVRSKSQLDKPMKLIGTFAKTRERERWPSVGSAIWSVFLTSMALSTPGSFQWADTAKQGRSHELAAREGHEGPFAAGAIENERHVGFQDEIRFGMHQISNKIAFLLKVHINSRYLQSGPHHIKVRGVGNFDFKTRWRVWKNFPFHLLQ